MAHTAFYDTIYNLRMNGEITLFDRIMNFDSADEELVKDFLLIEYETEAQDFPNTPPHFDADAALWGARTMYTICQLILYRQHRAAELPSLLPVFTSAITASAMLSADLCLRFLPQVLKDTKHIDPEDALIEVTETHLHQWHYSGIGYGLATEMLDFTAIKASASLWQLYADRIIEKKDISLANADCMKEKIKASMGAYNGRFWKELN